MIAIAHPSSTANPAVKGIYTTDGVHMTGDLESLPSGVYRGWKENSEKITQKHFYI